MGSQIDWKALVDQARLARDMAYAPYSRFLVGAAVLSKSGAVFAGSNVENASLGLTICAERVAVSSAVSSGNRDFTALVVVADTPEPVMPCGACRQFLIEFGPALQIRCVGRHGIESSYLLSELLPAAFKRFQE